MKLYPLPALRLIGVFALISSFTIDLAAQVDVSVIREQQLFEGSGNRWWFTMFFIVVTSLSLAFYLWKKSQQGANKLQDNTGSRYRDYYQANSGRYDSNAGVDADKELEWLRKAKQSARREKTAAMRKKGFTRPAVAKISLTVPEPDLDTKQFQEKMRKLQYTQLPINSFTELKPAKMYTPLPLSSDPSLVNAIDQANEEFEEDETVRALAVKILAAFRTRNSVDALSQIALYDLSANLRSKAVSILTEFDHESVFEPMLLACADPTREVRAAAARGLFRLNFDRADAWRRVIDTNDGYRMSHAARAAIEAGIVLKSFDRLVHEDLKVAYEAFVLVAFLIYAGETTDIFDTIKSHKDERVRFALLHVLKVIGDERTIEQLRDLHTDDDLPADVAVRVRETSMALDAVPA